MIEARRQELLNELKARILADEIGSRPTGATPHVLPFGIPDIDRLVPSGGLMLGAVHEVVGAAGDARHAALPATFIGGILARTTGVVIWAMAYRDLFAPALAGVGLHPDRVIYVEARDSKTVLLVMEESLRHTGLAAVVGEVDGRIGLTASRRLQLAAEKSGVMGLLLRRPRRLAEDIVAEPTAARTRWRVSALPSGPALAWSPKTPGLARARWQLDLVRVRGGQPKSFIVEACDATGRLGLAAVLADRPAAQSDAHRRAAVG
jgi:protein ImuA